VDHQTSSPRSGSHHVGTSEKKGKKKDVINLKVQTNKTQQEGKGTIEKITTNTRNEGFGSKRERKKKNKAVWELQAAEKTKKNVKIRNHRDMRRTERICKRANSHLRTPKSSAGKGTGKKRGGREKNHRTISIKKVSTKDEVSSQKSLTLPQGKVKLMEKGFRGKKTLTRKGKGNRKRQTTGVPPPETGPSQQNLHQRFNQKVN